MCATFEQLKKKKKTEVRGKKVFFTTSVNSRKICDEWAGMSASKQQRTYIRILSCKACSIFFHFENHVYISFDFHTPYTESMSRKTGKKISKMFAQGT